MPRIRTLKPEALQHRKLGKASDRALRVWLALLTQADDEGRLVCDAEHLRVVAFAYHPRVSAQHVEAALRDVASLGGGGLVTLYTVKDTRYACLPSWNEHQKISHPTPSSLPGCDAPGAVLESPEGHFQRIRRIPRQSHVPEDSGTLRRTLEDSRTLQNALAPPRARARIGSDRIGRIGSEGSVAQRGRGRTLETAPRQRPARRPAPPSFRFLSRSGRRSIERHDFRNVRKLREPGFWQSQLRARPGVDFATEILEAATWCEANPRRAPKSDVAAFLNRWFRKAAEDADGE